MLTGEQALEILREGNQRFSRSIIGRDTLTITRRLEFTPLQQPFAIILSCSDSRMPADILFDQGFGDLFIIRVAGNIAAPSQLGSVEFAVERYGTRLVVVLGHLRCGAILAGIEELMGHTANRSLNLLSIVDRIRPSVETHMATEPKPDGDALMREAVRANVRASVNQLRHGTPPLERLLQTREVLVVGAEYSLQNGIVDFFDT